VLAQASGERSIDWAVGGLDWQSATPERNNLSRNHFNYLNAREAMWRALTLRRRTGTVDTDLFSANDSEQVKEDSRKAYWATVFRTLGDVLHLLQDAAQPQHTRNEAHSGVGAGDIEDYVSGHASVYESYIEARAEGTPTFKVDVGLFDKTVSITPRPLNLTGYPIPRFAKITDYFSTGAGAQSLVGRGMADYSSRGFFTPAKNLCCSDMPKPSQNVADYSTERINAVNWDGTPLGNSIQGPTLTIYKGTVTDTAYPAQTATGVAMTTRGVFEEFLGLPTYSLNHIVYDARADLLLPRAVGYSAGVLDYFFRGQMEISLPDEGLYAIADHSKPEVYVTSTGGFKKLKLKITNVTPDIVEAGTGRVYPQNLDALGDLVAIVKFQPNKCYEAAKLKGEWLYLSRTGWPTQQLLGSCYFVGGQPPREEIVVSDPIKVGRALANGATSDNLTFNFQAAIPINAMNVSLQVAYRGALGAEADAIAVATKDISEPTFYSMSNDLDYRALHQSTDCSFVSYEALPGGRAFKVDLAFNENGPPLYVAHTSPLLPGERSRLVFLSDSVIQRTRHLDNDVGPVEGSLIRAKTVRAEWASGGLVIQLNPEPVWPPLLRGSYADNGLALTHGVGFVGNSRDCKNPPSDPASMIANLPPYPPPDPKPVTIDF
jgi:hypothetical protein